MLSEDVKILRRKKGWAQEDSARQMDVGLSTVPRCERTGAKPARPVCRELKRLWKEGGIEPAVEFYP